MARLIEQILGQEQAWEKINQGQLAHALAFTGPPGVGKQKMAWALAQKLLCTSVEVSVDKPCGACGPCRRVENHQSESVLYIEATGAQIKLESAHQVLEFLALARMSPARIIIINDAQLLNPQTANALLKVIEEPPPCTHFLLIVPEISQLLPTLKSRAQVLRFEPLAENLLRQGESDIQAWMLKSARGSFEKLAAFRDEESNELRTLAFDFLKSALTQERAGLIRLLEHTKDRASALQTVRFMQQGLRDWTVLQTGELIHADFAETWRTLPAAALVKRAELWRQAHIMESDLNANVDRALIFENFYYRSQNAVD